MGKTRISYRVRRAFFFFYQVGLAALPGAPLTDAIAHELWRILMDGGRRARGPTWSPQRLVAATRP